MTTDVTLGRVVADAPSWPDDLAILRAQLGAPDNRTLFPAHFLQATLPKIGGEVVTFRRGVLLLGVGFCFPRALVAGRRRYTLRFNPVADRLTFAEVQTLGDQVGQLLGGAEVVCYDPTAPQVFDDTDWSGEHGLLIVPPSAADAVAIPQLQARIWGTAGDGLYPADLHSLGFAPGSSLAARFDGQSVGFLFGFTKFGGSPLPAPWQGQFRGDLRLESQLLGVLPDVRQVGIGYLLKHRQGEMAQQAGLGVVNWTVDPLQFGNAVLNFERLKAVACDFYPDHYGFRNSLNQVAASRFGITWLVQTQRVRQALASHTRGGIVNLQDVGDIPRVNEGWEAYRRDLDAPTIAIEVPAQWTELQHRDLASATRWRETTDAIFAHYLGPQLGQYAIVGVGQDGPRRYLLAARVTEAFLATYGEV